MQEGVKAYSKTRPIKIEEFDPIKKWWNKREESDVCWKVPIETIIDKSFDLDFKNPTKQEEAHEYNSSELMQMLENSFSKSNTLLNQLKAAVNE
jgi:type I restriction enzyme M protein